MAKPITKEKLYQLLQVMNAHYVITEEKGDEITVVFKVYGVK